jgi:hypothetical protein
MATKKKKTKAPVALTERTSPLLGNALLWVGFLVVLTVGIVTVFVPELTDEASDEDGAAAGEDTAPDDTTDSTTPDPATATP